MSSLAQEVAARKAVVTPEPAAPSCHSGGLRHNRAAIEFRPDPRKRVGFPWAQLCHYSLEANGDTDAPERLILAFSTADVVILGARLTKLADLVHEHDLDSVSALDPRYANLLTREPWVASITINRIDKQGGAAG